MLLQQKLGQLLMFGFPGTSLDETSIRLIEEYKLSNVILFSHNITSAHQMYQLCTELQQRIQAACGHSGLICIDQEGGVVSRFPSDAVSFPSAMAVAATAAPHNAKIAAIATARQLAALGVNCNLAPVLDINTNPQNSVIGVRSYGITPEQVSEFSIQSIGGHLEVGVLPVAKHFPGHGDTSVDSHLGLPCIDKTEDELMSCELIPFIRAIEAGVPAIMAAHILFPKIEPDNLPATMSPRILGDLLRKKLHFDGLIVSDCFEMGAIQDHYGTAEGFVAGLQAGLDIGCISHDPELALKALLLARQAVEDGTLHMSRIDEAVEHVQAARARFAQVESTWSPANQAAYHAAAQAMMDTAITRLDENGPLPLVDEDAFFISCPAYRATFASDAPDDGNTFAQNFARRFSSSYQITPVQPKPEDIESALRHTRPGQTVVAATYNGHLNRDQLTLVNRLAREKRKVICVALRNPYDLPLLDSNIYKIAAFEYTTLSFNAVERILRGEPAQGRLELAISKEEPK